MNRQKNSVVDNLFSNREEDYQSNIKESSENLRLLREKARKRNNSLSEQQSQSKEEEEEDDEDEDEDEDEEGYDDSDIELDEEEKGGLLNFAKKLFKKVGMSSLLATGASFGGVGLVGTLLISMYRIHYDGEFEFKGIGGEYQSLSFKKMNFTSFNKNGDVELGGLTKENKLTKTYYTLYSDNSYYAIVEDSNKYSNIDDAYKRENLLTPDELREQYPDIKDTEGREKMFQLNPDVLYSLDRYLHKNQFLYPQQFIKPVYYEESKDDFKLKDLVKDGKIVAKSQLFNNDGTPVKNSDGSLKKEKGIWDYGLASVLHYKEYEVKERTTTNISGVKMVYKGLSEDSFTGKVDTDKDLPKIGAEVTKTIKNTTPAPEHPDKSSGTSAETVSDKPAYAIDKAVTAGGTITSNVTQKWQEKEGSRKTETITDIITETEIIEVETEQDANDDGKPDIVQETRTHVYEVTYMYEVYTEEYVPYYEGDLDTSEITGSKYYRDYIKNYSNYIPVDVPKQLDFSVFDKNEEINELLSDDIPGQYSSGGIPGNMQLGSTFKAEFTAYYPANTALQGGFRDAWKGERLDPSKNTCAAPIKRDYPDSVLEFGSKILISGTGTFKDGTVCTVNDVGGAIKLMPDGTYKIDILVADRKTAYNAIGRRKGTITIVDSQGSTESSNTNQTLRTIVSNNQRSRTNNSVTLMHNTGGNAVTNYGMTIDEYAKKRVPRSCDSNTCSVENYRKNLEPDAYKDSVGDLRHLRLDVYRPVDEKAFIQKFAEKFDKKIAPYGQSFINVCKEKNVDVLAITAQIANESGYGKHAIIGNSGGKTYYNFTGIGAVDGNAYQGGLNYAIKKGWDTPEKAILGAVEFLANDYIHSEKYQQNTLYKIGFPFVGAPNGHFYASNPDYAYALASIMKSWTYLYSPGATFYYDLPTFDPNQPAGTTDGAGHGMQLGGTSNSSAIGAFNSYLASNWATILELKEDLFPWTKELDKLLDNDKKGDYKNAKAGDLPVRDKLLFASNLTSTDVDIVLSMMFALNQGNYLSKYDYMGEAEWKAMYNQLLSSPTGKTWDDKWIGFTCEEIFGKSLEDLGTLFKEGTGVNPTVSRNFGKLKNMYTDDDIAYLPQYNETNFGMDLSVPKDTEVLALEDGEIVAISKSDDILSRYGNFVQIKFNNNTRMVVANLKSVNKKIKVGTKVSKGDVLGISGGKCKSYKDGDLHIELLYKDEFINPEWIITRDMNGFDDPIEGNAGGGGVICGPNDTGNIATGGVGADYVETAKKQVGKPYVSGGTGPDGFDCSGLVQWSMAQHDIHISRTSRDQRKDTARITLDQLQPGDLIFRHGKYGSPKDTSNPDNVTHVMIYIGNNQYVHAPEPGRNVEIRNFKEEPGFSYGRFSGASNVSASNSSVSSSSGVCQTHNQTILNGGMPIPLNLQTDSRWADKPYGAGNPKGNTIKINGCAPTSISMVASYLTGKTIIPPDVTSWAGLKYYSSGAGSTWNIFGASAKHWGYNSKQISKTPQEVMKELNAGHPIIASMGPGAFTSGGHFIVLRGVTSDGQILVNDPASTERSEKSWSMSIIMNQSKAMWSFWK